MTAFVGSPTAPPAATATAFNGQIAYTVIGGADHLLVFIAFWGADPGAFVTKTWNGAGLSQLGATQGNATNGFAALFYILNPAAGNDTLDIAWTNSVAFGIYTQEFSGVNTSAPITNLNSAVGNSSTPAVTITTTSGDAAVCGAGIAGTNIASANLTATISGQYNAGVNDGDCRYGIAAGASTPCTWSAFGSGNWIAIGADIQAGAGSATDDIAPRSGAMQAITLMRERASGLLEPVRELWRPKRPRLLVP